MELYLRTEARPAKWDDLDTTQKEAFEVILQMIKEAVADLPRSRAHEFSDKVDWLSTSRSSRTVVLSGGRGTGKTTLLASLINATTGRNGDGRYGAVPQPVADTMAKIRGRIIWLEPMDMETVPRDSNLLASILVRIEDAIGRLGNIGRTDEGLRDTEYFPSGLVESGPDYQQAMLELQRVQTAIALAWEGNLQKRGAQIDPDAYAVELLRSENARLSVNKNLDAVLNKIAGQISWISNIRDPLFLLPIDDLDLNPIACLELLKMLRMISVPRLFALILGDIYVAEIVMNLKISGDLVQAANAGANAPELLSLGANEIAAVAGEVSANALRKLIPPNQRIRLGEMDVHEAIKFRPFGLLEGFSLYELLSQYPVALAGNMPFQDIDGTASAENRVDSLKKFLLVGQPEVFKELWNENQNAPKNESGLKEASDGQMSRPDIQKLQSDEISKSVYTGLSF